MRFNKGHFFSALTGLIAGGLLIGALPGMAANGDNMILGEKNLSKTVTRLNTRGGLRVDNFKAGNPALILNVAGDTAPMVVNSEGLVENLNADLLDGQEASAFAADGHDHDTDYLAIDGTAADSDLLDGMEASAFAADTETVPFVAAVNENNQITVFDGTVFDVVINCFEFAEGPDHKVELLVTSSVPWYVDGTARSAGTYDVYWAIGDITDENGYLIWSESPEEFLFVELTYMTAQSTTTDCIGAGFLVASDGA